MNSYYIDSSWYASIVTEIEVDVYCLLGNPISNMIYPFNSFSLFLELNLLHLQLCTQCS
jgi:hypothetical protein